MASTTSALRVELASVRAELDAARRASTAQARDEKSTQLQRDRGEREAAISAQLHATQAALDDAHAQLAKLNADRVVEAALPPSEVEAQKQRKEALEAELKGERRANAERLAAARGELAAARAALEEARQAAAAATSMAPASIRDELAVSWQALVAMLEGFHGSSAAATTVTTPVRCRELLRGPLERLRAALQAAGAQVQSSSLVEDVKVHAPSVFEIAGEQQAHQTLAQHVDILDVVSQKKVPEPHEVAVGPATQEDAVVTAQGEFRAASAPTQPISGGVFGGAVDGPLGAEACEDSSDSDTVIQEDSKSEDGDGEATDVAAAESRLAMEEESGLGPVIEGEANLGGDGKKHNKNKTNDADQSIKRHKTMDETKARQGSGEAVEAKARKEKKDHKTKKHKNQKKEVCKAKDGDLLEKEQLSGRSERKHRKLKKDDKKHSGRRKDHPEHCRRSRKRSR